MQAIRRVVQRGLLPRAAPAVRTQYGYRFCSSDAAELLNSPREAMEYDVVIVGAGPSGLSAAIRLRQLAAERDQDISVCVIEKGHEVGAHILSGNVFEPRALNELLPDWQERDAPVCAREPGGSGLPGSLFLQQYIHARHVSCAHYS